MKKRIDSKIRFNIKNSTLIEGFSDLFDSLNMDDITVHLKNKESPKYCYTSDHTYKAKTFYLPYNFPNDELFKCIEKHFKSLNIKNSTEIYIILHELGHAKQHKTVEYNEFHNQPINIKQGNTQEQLNYLFNGATVENKINLYLSENYRESYADCFAAFILFKEFGKIEIFDKVSEIRKDRFNSFKELNGNESIHPNSDYSSIIFFKSIVEKYMNKNNLLYGNLKFEDFTQYLETSLLRGTIKTIKKELEVNDAFLKEFKKYSKEFSLNTDKLTENKDIKNFIKNKNITELENKDLIEIIKNGAISSFLLEFKKRSNSDKIIKIEDIISFSMNEKINRIPQPKYELMKLGSNYSNTENKMNKKDIYVTIKMMRYVKNSNNKDVIKNI